VYDIIIIGAGPVGSYLACKLTRLGHSALVIERKVSVEHDVCCTGIISQACLDLLAIDNDVIARKANAAHFFAPHGESFRLWREHGVACIIDRPVLNTVLAQRAQSCGAGYLLSTRVENIENAGDHVNIKATSFGKDIRLAARAAIIATGFGSNLPGKSGLGKISRYMIGAQADVTIHTPAEIELYFDRSIAPGWFAWLVPTRGDKGLAGLMAHGHVKDRLEKFLSSLMARGKIRPPVNNPGTERYLCATSAEHMQTDCLLSAKRQGR